MSVVAEPTAASEPVPPASAVGEDLLGAGSGAAVIDLVVLSGPTGTGGDAP